MLPGVRPPPFPTLAVLAEALAELPSPELEGAAIEAAVLVCLHDDAVLLARRALHPEDPWSGHAALPGGRWEPGDAVAAGDRPARGARGARHRSARPRAPAGRPRHARRARPARQRRAHRRLRRSARRAAAARALQRARGRLLGAAGVARAGHGARRRVARQTRCPRTRWSLPGDDALVVWGITYAILERLRALPAV